MSTELVEAIPVDIPLQQPVLDVTVVLPCLNEEHSVGACVVEAAHAIAEAGWDGEVIVVDNGCTDRSAAVAVAAGARVVAEPCPGYGAAILAGIRAARGSIIVMADADCTYPLDQLAEIVHPVVVGEADLVLGSRLGSATCASMPMLHRFVGTPALTWLVRQGAGVAGLSDSQSGFRAFRRELADRLLLRASGMEFASEMLIRAAQRDIRVHEIPLGYRTRVGESKLSTWRDGWRHLRLILRLSPHLLLWHPGLLAMAFGVLTYVMGLAHPGGTPLGSLTWQPVFFGTILLVLGLTASISGALLGRKAPWASPRTRAAFAWIDDPRFLQIARRAGVGLGLVGLGLDVLLFAEWITDATANISFKMYLAGVAQGLLLSGTLLAAFAGLYRMLLRETAAAAVHAQIPSSR